MRLDPEISKAFALEGRTAVITGAASGMGREAARIFALAGAKLVLADVNEQGLEETAGIARGAGADAKWLRVDVSRPDEVESLADAALAEGGRLDVWINSAGVPYLHSILETSSDEANRTVAINMMGSLWGCMAAARVMRDAGGGAIVNVSSAGGSKPVPGLAVYGMTKAGVNSLTWTCATEFGPLGIRVNSVAPGWVETPMSSILYRDASGEIIPELREKLVREMRSQSPLGLVGSTSDIAWALLYLSCDASRFVTGQVLRVNGGESM